MNSPELPDSRARELLRRIVSEDEWKQFSKTGVLEVIGSHGTYRICPCELTRIVDRKSAQPLASACLQLSVRTPVHDRMIAEYLLIRNDEDFYWTTANIFPAKLDVASLVWTSLAIIAFVVLAVIVVRLAV